MFEFCFLRYMDICVDFLNLYIFVLRDLIWNFFRLLIFLIFLRFQDFQNDVSSLIVTIFYNMYTYILNQDIRLHILIIL